MKWLLASSAIVLLAACGNVTAPAGAGSKVKNAAHPVCRSGYIIAFDENGDPICVPAQ